MSSLSHATFDFVRSRSSATTITTDRKGPAKAKIYPGMFVLDGLAANQYNPR